MSNPHLSIVIPAHNEENRLPETSSRWFNFSKASPTAAEVLVVENASRDNTLKIARDFAARHPFIHAIHEDLPGKGRAVQTGMLAAVANTASLPMPTFRCPSARSTASCRPPRTPPL
jgi:dolichyl-phosphate beta-glucosyltransferase